MMVFIVLLYILPAILLVIWMLKMLKNSNESLKINREILERLKNNDKSSS